MVLGIDAAWTLENDSGYALLQREVNRWRLRGWAPSGAEFISLAAGHEVSWESKPLAKSTQVDPSDIIAAAERLSGSAPDVVVMDLPLSHSPICGRRTADDAISRDWGAFWASTHTPSAERPGPISAATRDAWKQFGFDLCTTPPSAATSRWLIETYPHPIAMTICRRDRRVPYKVEKAKRYWPDATPIERRSAILTEWRALIGAIGELIDMPSYESLSIRDDASTRALKRWEDAIDAAICCLTGTAFLEYAAIPHGDENAAIWLPSACTQYLQGLRQ